MDECAEYGIFPQVLDKVTRIIAIGDIHGDFDYLLYLLRMAKVIDENNNWIGGDTHVVQLGDQIDSCRLMNGECNKKGAVIHDEGNDITIIRFMDKLHKHAIKENGAVISLLGNHEVMNILGFADFVSYENIRKSGDINGRIREFSPYGKLGKQMICTRPSAIIIGSNLFVHAGILPDVVKIIPEMREIVRGSTKRKINEMDAREVVNLLLNLNSWNMINIDALDKSIRGTKVRVHNIIHNDEYERDISILMEHADEIKIFLLENQSDWDFDKMHPIETINLTIRMWLLGKINKKYMERTRGAMNSIFWNRLIGSLPSDDLSGKNIEECDEYIAPVLQFFSVGKMIVGHTPQIEKGINAACHGTVYRLDHMGSKYFNIFDKSPKKSEWRAPQLIEIVDDERVNILKYTDVYVGGGKKYTNYTKKYYII